MTTDLEALARRVIDRAKVYGDTDSYQLAQAVLDLSAEKQKYQDRCTIFQSKIDQLNYERKGTDALITRLKREVNAWAERYDFNYKMRIPYPEVEEA